MLRVDRLRVSLTKNGYLKIAALVNQLPSRHDILNNLDRQVDGIKLEESQVANVLSRDPITDEIPGFWDEIRDYGHLAVESFTLLAVIFSHHALIDLLRSSSQGDCRGCLDRNNSAITEKGFTNLVYSMFELRLCRYVKGATLVNYNLNPLIENLREAAPVVRKLIESKLQRCGWLDPDQISYSTDVEFFQACRTVGIVDALGMTPARFRRWIERA